MAMHEIDRHAAFSKLLLEDVAPDLAFGLLIFSRAGIYLSHTFT